MLMLDKIISHKQETKGQYIYTESRRRKFFQLGNHNHWISPQFSLGTVVVFNLYK